MSAIAEYLAGMQLQLKTWDTQFETLVAEGRKTSGETRTAYDRRLKELRLGRKAVQKSIDSARGATAALAPKAQAGVQSACDGIRVAIEKVSTDLRALPPDGGVRRRLPQPAAGDAPEPVETTAA